jgi:two-component system response regulator AlgR
MKILIVDDEPPARLRLRQLLAQIDETLIVRDADSGAAALEAAQREAPDVVLLDIHMPGMDGLETARHLALLPAAPAVVFVTAYDEHALAAFEVRAIDYLLKPVRSERLAESLQRVAAGGRRDQVSEAARALGGPRTRLAVTERGQLLLVPLDEVVFLRAEQKYVTIRTAEREYLTEESLTALEEEFGAYFVRIHRNALVARAAIRGFTRVRDEAQTEADGHWEVQLQGVAGRLAISRRQWPEVKAALRE